MRITALLLVIISLLSCKKDKDIDPIPEGVVQYEVTFDINWSQTLFPDEYPSNAHFSKFIGWSHKSNLNFFEVGTFSSNGIKSMAETGSTSPLDSEINTRVDNLEGLKLFVGDNLSSGVGTVTMNIYVDGDNPNITLVSMLAPSPDWYLGVIDVNLLDDNKFVESKTVKAVVYDAGTDSGVSYKSGNIATSPQEVISVLNSYPLGDGTKDVNIANVTFRKVK